MELDMVAIGKRIKYARTKKGYNQLKIKELSGISSGNLSDIENGKRLPSANTLVQLSEALNRSIDWILTGKVPTSENDIFSDVGDDALFLIEEYQKLDSDDRKEILTYIRFRLSDEKYAKGDPKSSDFEGEKSDTMAG